MCSIAVTQKNSLGVLFLLYLSENIRIKQINFSKLTKPRIPKIKKHRHGKGVHRVGKLIANPVKPW